MAYSMAPVAAAPVVATDPTNVFGRRVIAAGIDLVLIVSPGVAMVANDLTLKTREEYNAEWRTKNGEIPFEDYCDHYEQAVSNGVCSQAGDVLIVGPHQGGGPQVLVFVLLVLVGVVLQGLTAWTPGKLAMGLRTVDADGARCGLLRAGVRWLLWVVDGQPCGIPLVGFITGLTTQGHRRVGDMVAKTFVVRKDAMGAPIVVPGMTAPPPPGAWGQPAPAAWVPPTAPQAWSPPTGPAAAPPAGPGGWTAPPPPDWRAQTPQPAPPAPPGVEAPHWDDARNAYIQWDPNEQAWMQWDDPGQRWFRIAGQ